MPSQEVVPLLTSIQDLNCNHILYEIYRNLTILELYNLHEQFTYLKSSIGTFLKLLTHDAKRLSKRSKYHTVKPGHSRDYFCDIAARQKVSSDSIHKLFLSACIKSSPSTKTEDPYKGILLQEHLVFPILNFLINICQININVQTRHY